MYMLIGWCDGFGNDAYVKAVYATREEAIRNACVDDDYPPDKLIKFDFNEEIDFDYDTAESIVQEEEENTEVDWLSVAIRAVEDDTFLEKHADWIPDNTNDKDDIDDLVLNHHDWLEEYYNNFKELLEGE